MKIPNKIQGWLASFALAAFLSQAGAQAQSSSGTQPGGPSTGHAMGGNATDQSQGMMAEHQKMMEEMQNLDKDLDAKVVQMNQAQGNAKIDAMAAVINDLVKERQLMRQRMAAMQQRMTPHMQGHMGGATNSH